MFRATLFIITQTGNYPNVIYLHNLILHDENEQRTANHINIDESHKSKAECKETKHKRTDTT